MGYGEQGKKKGEGFRALFNVQDDVVDCKIETVRDVFDRPCRLEGPG